MKSLGGGKRAVANTQKKLDFSKRLINDNRYLLWLVNAGGLLLAFYCVYRGYLGGLGWIAGMVSCAWAAHGTICSWYFSMAKADHSSADGTGITYAIAQANGFVESCEINNMENNEEKGSWESPAI